MPCRKANCLKSVVLGLRKSCTQCTQTYWLCRNATTATTKKVEDLAPSFLQTWRLLRFPKFLISNNSSDTSRKSFGSHLARLLPRIAGYTSSEGWVIWELFLCLKNLQYPDNVRHHVSGQLVLKVAVFYDTVSMELL